MMPTSNDELINRFQSQEQTVSQENVYAAYIALILAAGLFAYGLAYRINFLGYLSVIPWFIGNSLLTKHTKPLLIERNALLICKKKKRMKRLTKEEKIDPNFHHMREALLRALEDRKKTDPCIVHSLASDKILCTIIELLKNNKNGVHTESMFCALDALAANFRYAPRLMAKKTNFQIYLL